MREGDDLVLLLLQRSLDVRERHSIAKRCNDLVDLRAVGAQTSAEIDFGLDRRAYPHSPVGETITEVTAIEDERVLAGLDKVGRDLTTGPVLAPSLKSFFDKVTRTWSQPSVPEPAMMNGWASWVKSNSLSIRMQSPKTGMKSAET